METYSKLVFDRLSRAAASKDIYQVIVLLTTSIYSISIQTVKEIAASIASPILLEHPLVPSSQIADAAAGSHDPLWT